HSGLHCSDRADLLLGSRGGRPCAQGDGRNGHSRAGARHGPLAGGPSHAVFRQWPHGFGRNSAALNRFSYFPTDRALAKSPNGCYSQKVATEQQASLSERGLQTRAACATLKKLQRCEVKPPGGRIACPMREVGSKL